MPIAANSRYANAVVQTLDTPMGARQEMRIPFPQSRVISYTEYRITVGDRIDTIAYDFYGDATLWWMIADANPEILDWFWDSHPNPIQGTTDDQEYLGLVGQVIRIPSA